MEHVCWYTIIDHKQIENYEKRDLLNRKVLIFVLFPNTDKELDYESNKQNLHLQGIKDSGFDRPMRKRYRRVYAFNY